MSQDHTSRAPKHEQPEEGDPLSIPTHRRVTTRIATLVVCIFLVLMSIVLWQRSANKTDDPSANLNSSNQSVSETPKLVERLIDGVLVEPGKENVYPVAVMIENAAFGGVRPQAGLQAANVVYEALAEGGITRFMAVFADSENVDRIGPVRSARPYFVDWAREYNGLYVHAGGSPQALEKITAAKDIVDLNEIYAKAGYFLRDPKAQSREHGLFTSSTLLAQALKDFDLSDSSGDFRAWDFAEPTEKVETDETQEEDESVEPTNTNGVAAEPMPHTITIPFSSAAYEVEYVYDAEARAYQRFNGGAKHIDALTSKQITVRTVIVQYMQTSVAEAVTGRLNMKTVGGGEALVFSEGKTIQAKWNKTSADARTIFTNLQGEEIVFVPGNLWIEVVPDDHVVEYTDN